MKKNWKEISLKALYLLIIILCLVQLIPAPIALLSGFLFAQLLGNPFPELSGKSVSLLLKASIVGLGFGINVDQAIQVSGQGLWLTVASILIVFLLGFVISKKQGLPRSMSYLISSGTAICGGSAIAAISPIVKAKESEISMALTVVFMLNSIALIIFPIIGQWLAFSDQQFGLWCAIAIHDTSSVVGAASTFGEEALQVATTAKLARALWIIPLSIVTALLFKNKEQKISIPYFILFFVVAILVANYIPYVDVIGRPIANFSKSLLIVAIFLIGSGLSFKHLKETGSKPFVLGISLWVAIAIFSAVVIKNLL